MMTMVLGHWRWAVVGSQCFKHDPMFEGLAAASDRHEGVESQDGHEGVPWFSLSCQVGECWQQGISIIGISYMARDYESGI